jgi:hypothetical protein
MPATPITNPARGESLVGIEPQLLQQVDPGWRRRLNLFTGRALSDTALINEQTYRAGLLSTLGQSVSAGTVSGLALSLQASGADPLLELTPGYGVMANGQDVILNQTLKTRLSTLAIVDITNAAQVESVTQQSGQPLPPALMFRQWITDPENTATAGILLLQPVLAQVSGQLLDTGSAPIIVSGNLGASCGQDPAEYAFEDWQVADAVQLVYMPWPAATQAAPALALPAQSPVATWRNRLAYTIFEAESMLAPDDQLPWSMLGVPVGLIGFDPGVAWKANTAYTVGQFVMDPSGNQQQVATAGTTAAAAPAWSSVYGANTNDGGVTWMNNGVGWKPLFLDCSAVVRAGGLPRQHFALPAQAPALEQWQSNTPFVVADFIIDANGNVQKVTTAGQTAGLAPKWSAGFGTTTTDNTVVWTNNGPASWQANTAYQAGQFIYDSNGYLQYVTVAGTSGTTEPTWNGAYLPTTDGSITWVNNAPGTEPIVQPVLAQARINQLSEQLSQTMAQQTPFTTLADIFPTLPPSGILPVAALNFAQAKAPWLPPNWTITAAPVRLEELETVLETGMMAAPLPLATAAPADPSTMEPVEVLVPLPDAVYDPNILVVETVAPIFQQELTDALDERNLALQQMNTVQEEINVLLTGIGPNIPATAGLIDPNAGLSPQEIAGRDLYPPYTPTAAETFATTLPSTWTAGAAKAVGAFIIDGNGVLQVATVAGTTGTAAPTWNTTVAGLTTDGSATWLNNGPWTWQPSTAYVAGQFVIDSMGFRHVVTVAGTSASDPPAWSDGVGATTQDGVIWQPGGRAIWQPDTLYAVGTLIFDSHNSVQIVQSGGISGDSPPSWNPNLNQTTQDGGVTWKTLGNSLWQPNTAYSAGQAVVDSSGAIQTVQAGGTSGTVAPTWTQAAGATIMDAAVNWSNAGPMTWQAGTAYAAGALVLDSNCNIQQVKVAGTSGATAPVWSTTPAGTTTDGGVTWTYFTFVSTDLQTVLAVLGQAPYVTTYTDSTGATQTVNLLSAADMTTLTTNGLQTLVTSLSARISAANDLLDTAFLTAQTDIYRFRQNVLGATAASALATSPVLANIAKGSTATATSADLQSYMASLLPTSTTTATAGAAPTTTTTGPAEFNNISFQGFAAAAKLTPPAAGGITATYATDAFTGAAVKLAGTTATRSLRDLAVTSNARASQFVPAAASKFSAGVPAAAFVAQGAAPAAAPAGAPAAASFAAAAPAAAFTSAASSTFAMSAAGSNLFRATTLAPNLALSPTTIYRPISTIIATPVDITNQSPLPGAQLNIRTLTVAERLAQSPSQESMFYSIANRLSFLQALTLICQDLNLAVDDLQITIDQPPATGSPAGTPAPTKIFRMMEWRTGSQQTAIQTAIQTPYLPTDAPEATLFSVGVRVVEQHTMLLRELEARVQQYSDFVTLCKSALTDMRGNIQQARVYLAQLGNSLQQARQDVAFTTSLLSDETARVAQVNAQRQQVLQSAVQLIAYTRARTLEATDTVPSRQLEPANVANPVPACLQQSVAIPPELREIVAQLREAPVNWLPSVAVQMTKLERPSLLQQLALNTQARAVLQLQSAPLPSSSAGEPGNYAATISSVYSANQVMFRNLQTQRAAIQPAALINQSWSIQVANLQSVAAVNDLISSNAVHAEVSNAVARLIQQISNVATCLYTRVSIALPVDRLAWAEYLSGPGTSVALQSLAILPNWNQLGYTDRQQMQMLVDWLFLQIDTSIVAAAAFMSDVVRTAILLASDVPIDNTLSAGIIVRAQPIIGGVVSLSLSSSRVASGMFVQLYSGSTLAARAVVTDLDSNTVSATVTDVFKNDVFLETTDTAHITAQTPQAVALRPLFT